MYKRLILSIFLPLIWLQRSFTKLVRSGYVYQIYSKWIYITSMFQRGDFKWALCPSFFILPKRPKILERAFIQAFCMLSNANHTRQPSQNMFPSLSNISLTFLFCFFPSRCCDGHLVNDILSSISLKSPTTWPDSFFFISISMHFLWVLRDYNSITLLVFFIPNNAQWCFLFFLVFSIWKYNWPSCEL